MDFRLRGAIVVNTKLRLVSAGNSKGLQPGDTASGLEPTSTEGHRLLSAFWRIEDTAQRQWLIETAERMARNRRAENEGAVSR
jgi:hypothetical protein